MREHAGRGAHARTSHQRSARRHGNGVEIFDYNADIEIVAPVA